jgi:hypothetical protein
MTVIALGFGIAVLLQLFIYDFKKNQDKKRPR